MVLDRRNSRFGTGTEFRLFLESAPLLVINKFLVGSGQDEWAIWDWNRILTIFGEHSLPFLCQNCAKKIFKTGIWFLSKTTTEFPEISHKTSFCWFSMFSFLIKPVSRFSNKNHPLLSRTTTARKMDRDQHYKCLDIVSRPSKENDLQLMSTTNIEFS